MTAEQGRNEGARTFKFLPLTVSIETLGGIATPVIPRGTPLPVWRSRTFSTASDNQTRLEAKFLLGESPIAANNELVGTLRIGGFPEAKRGEPGIIITFQVNEACKLKVDATLKDSSSKLTVQFDEAQIDLTNSRIKRLLRQAQISKVEDYKLLRPIELRNAAEALISQAEARIREHQSKGSYTQEDEKIEEAIASLGLALETNDIEEMDSNIQKLKKLLEASAITTPPFGYVGFGDIFENIFGTPKMTQKPPPTKPTQERVQQKVPSQEPLGKGQEFQNQLATTRRYAGQIGQIFGRGEFTLDPNLCFVLMPFGEKMYPIYDDHIHSVVTAEGLTCLRADEIVSTDLITSDIWEQINRARFIIADLTGRNPNVFYEVGLAHALGKDVIMLTQTMDDVPFDLQALRYIVYSYTPRGMKEMEAKLRETITKIMRGL